MSERRMRILMSGQVQGVGLRPYIYRLAHQLDLSGWVRNSGEGVIVEIQGKTLSNFIERFTQELPPLAKVDSLQTEIIPVQNKIGFFIRPSESGLVATKISPDVATCDECLQDLFNPNSRYYRYPFLNCTHCGPRLTITRSLPYDRSQTSMADFLLCQDCQSDYDDVTNRRYHAQPTACSSCGPRLSLSIDEIAQRIKKGDIIALKGLGGYQIICDARNEASISTLRKRKQRVAKPFAIMCANILSSKSLVEFSEEEEKLLVSAARPIVLLKKIKGSNLPDTIAPGLSDLGVMLPYTPLHYLLFNALAGYPDEYDWLTTSQSSVLIVTSANLRDQPLLIADEIVETELNNITDTIVSYNRSIVTRVDDSVIRVIDKNPLFIRRARGYVPTPIKLAHAIPSTLALGGYLKNTFCITRHDEAFVSQHIGNLNNRKTVDFFHESLQYMMKFLNVKPERLTHDFHPDFYTTQLAHQWADEWGVSIFPVQHHHAHLASVAAEHHLQEPALGLALDGYGFGEKGEAWGGELCWLDGTNWRRVGSFKPLPLLGGDSASREPWRMGVSALYLLRREDEIYRRYLHQSNLNVLIEMLQQSLNCPLTTSCGRLFDAASAIAGIQSTSHYEGHAAMRLESLVTKTQVLPQGWLIQENRYNMLPTLEYLLGCDQEEAANIFHGTMIAGLAEWVAETALQMNVTKILLSGGCFLNRVLSEGLVNALRAKNLTPLLPRDVPPNDGGISLGQAWIAGRKDQCV